jgi:hypothetical protein
MNKRLIKLIGFIPMLFISAMYFPIAVIQWVRTGVLPYPPIKHFLDW